jgi:hypothetical protein
MNKFCFDLNLNISPINDSIEAVVHSGNRIPIHKKISQDAISAELKNIFAELNMHMDTCETFYTPANMKGRVHRDGNIDDFIKLNFIFGGKDSKMNWYAIKTENNAVLNTSIGTHYTPYKLEDVEKVYSAKVNFPSIVQVGVPHNIENFSEPRYCLSIVLSYNGKKIPINQGLLIFKDYLSNQVDSI